MNRKTAHFLLLGVIIAVAALFRFTGVNWDMNSHLHPDERFLTMVGVAMKIPSSISAYLDPKTSTMNPANIGYVFYVYGLIPMTMNKIFAVLWHNDTYNLFTTQGRVLSGFMDIIGMFFLYKIIEVLQHYQVIKNKSVKYWAAFGYAIAVLPVQLSHFFAVDTFLNTFSLMSVYFILRVLFMHKDKKYVPSKVYLYTALSAVSWGLALSSKVTAVFMLPLILGLAVATYHKKYRWNVLGVATVIWLVLAYFTVRTVNPYMFETSSVLNPQISTLYIKNLKELKGYEDPKSFFPPIVQWSHTTPIIYSFGNLFLYSYGPVGTLLTIAGMILVFRKKDYVMWVFSVWVLLFFLFQSTQMTQPVRYFNHQFPYYALFAGVAVVAFTERLKKRWSLVAIPILIIWPLAFMSIYVKPHARIAASEWIYNNITRGKVIAVEHWDDALPITLDDQRVAQFYTYNEIPVFAPDSDPNKWNDLYGKLNTSDYYILSSNRAWRSVQNAPDKYPYMSVFYRSLFNGTNQRFKKEAHFASFPSLRYLGIPLDFPDSMADETFTVYDHPEVYIFKRL